MNSKNVVLSVDLVSAGALNSSDVNPRRIRKPAILASAAAIILVHDYPSRDPAPSKGDVVFTRRFAKCVELIGIGFLDHAVVSDGSFQSLKESGTF